MALIVNTTEFDAKITELLGKSAEFRKAAISVVADYAVTQAKKNLDKNGSVVTGKLKNSINYTVTDDGMSAKAVVGPNATTQDGKQYGYYVEYGRGPVFAKNAKALHFTGKDGSDVFVKLVAAAPAKPFMRPAVEAAQNKMKELVRLAFQQYAGT